MKKILSGIFALFLMFSISAHADINVEIKDLPRDRTSMEYGAKIKDLLAVIGGYKWENKKNHEGFTITQIENKFKNTGSKVTDDAMFFEIKQYYYDKEIDSIVFYARESERVGFVEFLNWENNSGQYHIKVVNKDTLEIYNNATEKNEKNRMIFEKTETFDKDPSKPRLKSASESGMIF